MASDASDLRNEFEHLIRSWDALERGADRTAVIDYDCLGSPGTVTPATDRLAVLVALQDVAARAARLGIRGLEDHAKAHAAYLAAALGQRAASVRSGEQRGLHGSLTHYVSVTQGCGATGWSHEYIEGCGARLKSGLGDFDVPWDSDTDEALKRLEGLVPTKHAGDIIREEADRLEPHVRSLVGTDAPFELEIENADVQAYWWYWLDGAAGKSRLRLNLPDEQTTRIQLQQFALHEVLGHALQSASWAQTAKASSVSWVRLVSVHAQYQVLLEGLAQALPLFLPTCDPLLELRVRLIHYIELVRSQLHIAINAGASPIDCWEYAHAMVPYWSPEGTAPLLVDRSIDPQLRSYLWAYPAGCDWFVRLADSNDKRAKESVLRAAYERPLVPRDLQALWPGGPTIGGDRDEGGDAALLPR